MVTIRAFVSVDRSPASVVFPLPGGPSGTRLGRWPDWVSGRSTSTTRRWPTRSSNFFGRIRVASGGAGRRPASFGKSSPWSIPDRILNSTDTMPPSEDLLVLRLGDRRPGAVLPRLRAQPVGHVVQPAVRRRRPRDRHLEPEVRRGADRPGGEPRRPLPPPAFTAG